jgi:hypothetical protein
MPTLAANLLSDANKADDEPIKTKRKKKAGPSTKSPTHTDVRSPTHTSTEAETTGNKTVTLTSSPHAVINFGKGGKGSGRVAGYGMLEGKPGRKVTRQKNKSITLGKGGPGSGPQGGKASKQNADVATKDANAASKVADRKGSVDEHEHAMIMHRAAASANYKAGNKSLGNTHMALMRLHDNAAKTGGTKI